MQAVFIVFNQAHTEPVKYILDILDIRGYTWWSDVKGRGSDTGEPRLGTHTWPEMNSALLTVVPLPMVEPLLEKIKKLDQTNPEIGLKAFVWEVIKEL
jgi:nitrogen regulatory protein PII